MRPAHAISFASLSILSISASAFPLLQSSGSPVEFHDEFQYNGVKKKGPCEKENGDSGTGAAPPMGAPMPGGEKGSRGGAPGATAYTPDGCVPFGPGSSPAPGPNRSSISIQPILVPPAPATGSGSKGQMNGGQDSDLQGAGGKTLGYGKSGTSWKQMKYGLTNASVGSPIASEFELCGDYQTGLVTLTGHYRLFRSDLVIPGRGIDWRFSRIYKQERADGSADANYDTYFGNGWNFTYNDRLHVADPYAVTLYEGGRHVATDFFDSDQNGIYGDGPDYIPFSGENRQLVRTTSGSYELIELDASTWHFDSTGRLESLEDRAGNRLEFFHGEGTAPAQALTTVIDTLGREIRYTYENEKLTLVTDMSTGRQIVFDYDNPTGVPPVPPPNGNMIGVTTPGGVFEQYTYTLQNNQQLLSELTDSYGEIVVTNAYGTFDGGTNRVTDQWRGPSMNVVGSLVNNHLTFTYTDSWEAGFWPIEAPFDSDYEDWPTRKTTIVDRRGTVRHFYTSAAYGSLTREEVEEDDVLDDENPPTAKRLLTRYRYGYHGKAPSVVADPSLGSGQLTQVTYADGEQIDTYYEAPASPMLPTGSNPVRVERRPGITKDPVSGVAVDNGQPLHVMTYTYEPIFNQLRSVTETRGNDPGFVPPLGTQSPARYTTNYIFDYMEGSSTTIAALAAKYRRPLTSAQLTDLALSQDVNGDSQQQDFGNVIKIVYPSVELDPSSPQVAVEGGTSQSIFELMGYDATFGQIAWSVDPEGNYTTYAYHPETDPDGDGVPTAISALDPTPPADTSTGGYLKEVVADAPIPGGSNAAFPTPHETTPPVAASTQFLYDVVGNLTKTIDPLGRVTLWEFDDRNLVTNLREAFGSPDERETGLTYDLKDRLTLIAVKNPDSPAGPWVNEEWDYDLENRVTRHRREISNGSFAESIFLLDPNGNVEYAVAPEGNAIKYEYNVRNQVSRVTRGFGYPLASLTEFFYDSRGNRKLVQGNTGGVSNTLLKHFSIYDGFQRLVSTVDPVGARTKLFYDVASQLVKTEVFGYPGGPSPADNLGASNILLSRVHRKHDERGRVFEVARDLMNSAGHSQGDANGQVVSRFAFDRKGRPTFSIESDGDTYKTEWDGRNRVSKKIDPAGNTSLLAYDEADNLIETTQTDVATIAGVAAENFTTTLYYDDLNRLIQAGDNLGNTRRWRYDTQGNVLQFADANGPLPENLPRRATPGTYIANLQGNVTNFFYDGLNRQTKKEILLTATGRGDGTWNPPIDTKQSGDGKITIQTVWDKNSRVVDQIDDKGNVTRTFYDPLDRKTGCIYGFGTSSATTESWIYDGADRVTQFIDQNGTQIQNSYDLASRPASKSLLAAGSGVTLVGTLSQSFEWDGLGRLTKGNDDNGATLASFTRAYDSLSRQYLENQIYGSLLTTENFWTAENLRTAFVYPNARQLTFTHDNLNRLDALEGMQYEYIGRGRLLERTNPNGTKLSYLTGSTQTGYDGMRRIVHQKWVGPASSLLADFEYTHDREHHRKTARRWHQVNGSNQPKGEFYDYDSAYRLIDWKESWVTPSVVSIPPGGGTATISGSGSFTITSVQPGGFPVGTQYRTVLGTATDTQEWTLDGVGNWETMQRKGTSTNNAINVFNEYTSWGATPQSHDKNGNLLDDGVYLYQYDFLNRMRTVTLKASSTLIASYAYDAMNRRVEKTVSSVATRFLYDGWHAVEERVAGTVTKQFVYGERLDEALKMDTYSSGSISATHYYHTDALGSVVALTNTAGVIAERVKYSPYGQPYWMNASSNLLLDGNGKYVNASTVGNPLLFTAARYDGETANRTSSQITDVTGVYYLRNRYLDSDKGRFTTRDPIGIWGDEINLGGGQAYCGNDPINLVDPLGLAGMVGPALAYAAMQRKTLCGVGSTRTPATGPPNTTVDLPGGGKRVYGPDGRAIKDIDSGHDHGAGKPHVHDWDWGEGKPVRGPGRPPIPGEIPTPGSVPETSKPGDEMSPATKIAVGAGAAGAGYLIYRGFRMLPSLLPPLWPTIPANLAIP